MPTFETVKLRPLFTIDESACFAFFSAFIDRCFSNSVLFFARRSEFDLFLISRLGAEFVLPWPLDTAAKGLLVARAGVDSVLACDTPLPLPVI